MNNANKNKPNSNPIKPNFRKDQMNVNSLITKDYRKKDDFAVQKNKPKTNPKQTNQSQLKPIQSQNKPNTNPKQTQSNPISNPAPL